MSAPTRIDYFPLRDGRKPNPGVRYVGRTSRHANPYRVIPHGPYTLAESLALFRSHAETKLAADPQWLDPLRDATALGCACLLELPCHVDVLIELIEATTRPDSRTT